MPEFHLNLDNVNAANWHSLSDFAKGFIEAAFFSESSCFHSSEFFSDESQDRIREGQADGNIPNDAGPEEIDARSLAQIIEFCAEFQTRAADLLALAYARPYDDSQGGRDLYFTHAGHGVGFWSRDVLELDSLEYESLTAEMVAASQSGDNAAWSAACAARSALPKSLGDLLSDAAGRGEINLSAYQSDKSDSGFLIAFDIY
jgi:hypothetical protein